MEPKNDDDRDRERLVDSWLDRSLKQYGEAEPRPGLEGRVRANPRVERERRPEERWSWAPALAVLLAVMVGGGMYWARGPSTVPETTTGHLSAPVVPKEAPAPLAETEAQRPAASTFLSSVPRIAARRSGAAVADQPRLEQFPSPRPLSEQEEMLVRYVRDRPQEAKLEAQARAELLKQDLLEFEKQDDAPEPTPDLQP